MVEEWEISPDRGLSAHLLGLEYHFGVEKARFAGLFDDMEYQQRISLSPP